MRSTRPIFWIFVPLLAAFSATAIWATFHFGPIGKPSQVAIECENLRSFIIAEEVEGKGVWLQYRNLVDEYLALPPTSAERIPLVSEMAASIIEVLGHDLAIYQELESFPKCVLQSKKDELPGIIEETSAAINFLSGTAPIDGTYFDPKLGSWNSTYYEEYLSALDFLKSEAQKAKLNADV